MSEPAQPPAADQPPPAWIKPCGPRYVIRQDLAPTEVGAIKLTKQAPPPTGTIVLVGEGLPCPNLLVYDHSGEGGHHIHVEPLKYRTGTRVCFVAYAGTQVPAPPGSEPDGHRYLLVEEASILYLLE